MNCKVKKLKQLSEQIWFHMKAAKTFFFLSLTFLFAPLSVLRPSCPSSLIISRSPSTLPVSFPLLPYFSICLILARPLTHKSNTGHLNTICLLPMESRMGWRESRGGSIAPSTVSPLTRFHIHLPPPAPHPTLFFHVLFQTQ